MKATTILVCFLCLFQSTVFGQDFIQLSKKVPQAILPYTTSSEFLDIDELDPVKDFTKYGIVPLTNSEIIQFIDSEYDPEVENYFAIHRLQLTPKLIGLVYYKQIYMEDDFETSSYNYLLTTYSLSGTKLSTCDFIGYEWLIEQIDFSEEELEEEENFEEMEEDIEELEFIEEDSLLNDDVTDTEIQDATFDEGYAISTISIVKNEVFIERKSISYYTKDTIATTIFKLDPSTGVFNEIEQ